jgi:hypothetical protein
MSAGGEMDRRKFLAGSAGASGALVGAASAAQAQSREPPSLEEGFNLSAPPLVNHWRKQLGDVTQINFDKEAGELNHPAVQERHRIYSYLLMKLIHRFWNGNKNGPLGTYPQRTAISDTTSPVSPSTASATSSTSISTTIPFSGTRSSTPSRVWCGGCSA